MPSEAHVFNKNAKKVISFGDKNMNTTGGNANNDMVAERGFNLLPLHQEIYADISHTQDSTRTSLRTGSEGKITSTTTILKLKSSWSNSVVFTKRGVSHGSAIFRYVLLLMFRSLLCVLQFISLRLWVLIVLLWQ